MINGQRVLAVIPARGGSKGVPRKNVRKVGNKPLLAWSIEAARGSRYIDRVVLSSEDAEIMAVAEAWGCEVPFARPADLARDETSGVEPILHAIEALPGYDFIVVLQPTSPLRTAEDIDGCLALCYEREAGACVSVTEVEHPPYWMFLMDQTSGLQPLFPLAERPTRRQDAPSIYRLNGAVYVARTSWLQAERSFITSETLGYSMPVERSIDIDTEHDLHLLECEIQLRGY